LLFGHEASDESLVSVLVGLVVSCIHNRYHYGLFL
jgi:hypothetical protein